MTDITLFQQQIVQWYKKFGRKQLPWQQQVTPYKVWISEIMLQQTQVATVIPYFDRFMQRFPTIKALACASLDDVLHHWSGLGYYSRARNLHASAKIIAEQYSGEIPQEFQHLIALPGIGRSTAGAILALGYKKRAAILDGNVKRVLSRYHGIADWIDSSRAQHKLWELAEQYTPEKKFIAPYTQAMMDLGALICTRATPQCDNCPLNTECAANKSGQQSLYPQKKPKKSAPRRETFFVILEHEQGILLEKRPPVGIWGGLWCFPECSTSRDVKIWCKKNYGLKILSYQLLPVVHHTFSHFQLAITPIYAIVAIASRYSMEPSQTIWYNPEQAPTIGLAAPTQKLLRVIQESQHES